MGYITMAQEMTVAQTQAVSAESNQLIKNRPEDLLFQEIERLRKEEYDAEMTVYKANALLSDQILYARCYINLAGSFFKIKKKHLSHLNPEQRKVLSKLIFQRAKRWAIFQRIFIVASFFIFQGDSITYRRLHQKLIEISGEDGFLPNDILSKAIAGDYEPEYDDAYYD